MYFYNVYIYNSIIYEFIKLYLEYIAMTRYTITIFMLNRLPTKLY